ncbi:hypothetical protein BH11PSE9_BH11PSE9_16560 [soil metagenome]
MSIKSLSFVAAAALALCAGATQAATVNGFANGGFEMAGTTTPADAWLKAASGYTLSSDAHSGSFSAQLASPALNAAVMLQNSKDQGGLMDLTAGDNPTLSFWAKGNAGGTGNLVFALRFLDNNGNIKFNSGDQHFEGAINSSGWTQITYTPSVVPVGATAAFIEFSQGIGPIDTNLPAGRVLIDDVYLGVTAAVPEPETYALMLAGLGVVGALVRRRRAA